LRTYGLKSHCLRFVSHRFWLSSYLDRIGDAFLGVISINLYTTLFFFWQCFLCHLHSVVVDGEESIRIQLYCNAYGNFRGCTLAAGCNNACHWQRAGLCNFGQAIAICATHVELPSRLHRGQFVDCLFCLGWTKYRNINQTLKG
jgi:hypothetical protein